MTPRRHPVGPVAAVVVSYYSAGHLDVCLRSLGSAGVTDIVVVDNASGDNSRAVAETAGARWLQTGANLGYGRAANAGAATVDPDAGLLVCNADLLVRPGAVAALAAALQRDPSLGVVGPRVLNPDGTTYPSARTFPDLAVAMGHGLLGLTFPGNRFTRRYRLLDWDHRTSAHVDWVSGACFLARREAWDSVSGFDPSYFMYMEDVDLCWRLRRAGWTVGYEPAAEVVHAQGASAGLHPYRMLAAHHVSMWRFAWRTTGGPGRAALPLVGAGLAARFGAAAIHRLLGGSTADGIGRPLP